MDFQGSLSTLAKILIITSTACFVVTAYCPHGEIIKGTLAPEDYEGKRDSFCVKAHLCDTQRKRIDCEADKTIKITYAEYSNYEEVTDCSTVADSTDKRWCTSLPLDIAHKVVRAWCDGKRSCMLEAGRHLFGGPCDHIVQGLRVAYDCIFNQTIERYTPDFQADIDVEVARIKASKPEHIWEKSESDRKKEKQEQIMAGLIPGFFVFAAFFAFLSYRKYVMKKNEKDDSSSGDEEPADAEEGAAYTISEVESSDVTEVQSSSANPVH